MKSFLELASISARVHRKQNLMTRLCIVLAVSLTSCIFGMADMEIRSQKIQTARADGTWHAVLRGISEEQAALITARPDVESGGWYGTKNYRLDEGYCIEGVQTCVLGMDQAMLDYFPNAGIVEGELEAAGNEDAGAVITASVKERLGISLNDTFTLALPYGADMELTVTGITGNSSMLTRSDAFGIYVNMEVFHEITKGQMELARQSGAWEEKMELADSVFYIRFSPWTNIQKSIGDIKMQFGLSEEQVGENTRYLALMLQSRDSYMIELYLTAVILAVLVILAGVLMITGSLNASVGQRTEFFGLLACLGATEKQIRQYVRKEALAWCRTAIPCGMGVGILVVWLLCGILRFLSPEMFSELPAFGISPIGTGAGIAIGLITVLLAVRTPARYAARVSPLTAVSGNAGSVQRIKHAARTAWMHVDTALGIHHAVGSLRGFSLMAGSFSFSIILFLAFSSLIAFVNHGMRPLKPYAPDLSIISEDESRSLPKELAEQLAEYPAVKRVYGRSFAYDVPVNVDGVERHVDLLSYEEQQFDWAEKVLLSGSLTQAREGSGALTVYQNGNLLQEGSILTLETPEGSREVTIAGLLSDSPFTQEGETEFLICSEELFRQLAGDGGYTVIDIQLARKATDEDVEAIRYMAGEGIRFSDRRMSNSETKGAYLSLALFVYGFLAVIALISIFHIVNSISMSVDARMKQYGSMRAIGMSDRQFVKMTAAEASAYGICGMLFGCLAGIPLHKKLFEMMVTFRWGTAWQIPIGELCVILPAVCAAVVLAVWVPARRIRRMSVVDTIGVL